MGIAWVPLSDFLGFLEFRGHFICFLVSPLADPAGTTCGALTILLPGMGCRVRERFRMENLSLGVVESPLMLQVARNEEGVLVVRDPYIISKKGNNPKP